MTKIVAKLNLNKSPQDVENCSLIFAKNIRLLKDGAIAPDTSLDEIDHSVDNLVDEESTVIDTPSTSALTTEQHLTIYNYTNYDNTNPTHDYLELNSTTYDDIVLDNQFSIDLSGTVYNGDSNTIVSNNALPVHYIARNGKIVTDGSFKFSLFVYFIHIDSYGGVRSFDDLRAASITPFYIGFIQSENVGRIILINGERYIVIYPVVLDVVENIITVPGTYHTHIVTNRIPTRYVAEIVGLDNKIYIFREASYQEFIDNGLIYPLHEEERIRIFEYDEINRTFTLIKCGWRYSGGEIDGQVTTNNTNEKILTICEYFEDASDDQNIPIKHLNLSKVQEDDDESIYTQTPNIPFTNLYFIDFYQNTIPNGVYQFFVRYKIRDDFYTEWFPCSNELYAGSPIITDTIQGRIRHINSHLDCPRSFVLKAEHLFNGQHGTIDYSSNFTEYQIGFILSHEDSVVARAWKSFDFTVTDNIYFDYDKNVMEEVDIDEMLKTAYEISNVKNITYYKNKYFISNYKETNFNPDLNNLASSVVVTLNSIQKDFSSSVPRVNGKELSKSDPDLSYYDLYDGNSILSLFDNKNVVDGSVISDTLVNYNYYSGSNYVLNVETFWKKGKAIDASANSYERDVCWLRKSDTGLSFDNGIDVHTFSTYDYSSYEEPVTPGLIHSNWEHSGKSRWYNLHIHPIEHDSTRFNNKWYWRGGWYIDRTPTSFDEDCTAGWGWPAYWIWQHGMYDIEGRCVKKWEDIYKQEIESKYPRFVLSKLIITHSGGSTQIVGGNDVFSVDNKTIYGEALSYVNSLSDDDLQYVIFNKLRDHIKGVTINDNVVKFVIEDSGNYYEINNITAVIVKLSYTISHSRNNASNDEQQIFNIYVKADCTQKTVVYNCTIKSSYVTCDFINTDYRTLMPFTDYEFYIHYIKQNGIATNGYYISTERYDTYTNHQNELEIIYPSFTHVTIPDGYVGYFISINKVKNNVARLFNIRINPSNKDRGYAYADCLEADTMLYPLSKNVEIFKNQTGGLVSVSANGEYFSSGNSNPITEFGSCGEVRWPIGDDSSLSSDIVYSPISMSIYIDKHNTTGGILVRAGFDNTNHTFINALIELSDCATNDVVTKTGLETQLATAISGQSCLEVTVKAKRYGADTEEEERSDIIPINEIIGYIVTFSSKVIQVYSLDYNDVIFLGLNLIEDTDLTEVSNAITTINSASGIDSTNINASLPSILQPSGGSMWIEGNVSYLFLENVVESFILENNYWIKLANDTSNNKNKQLIKITPYIITENPYNNQDLNLPGFICVVNKLNHEHGDNLYVSGTDVYDKEPSENHIALSEALRFVGNIIDSSSFIPSNFNLNCVTLNDDITQSVRTYYPDPNDESIHSSQFIKGVNSLICSSILTLPTMYYDYIRKTYSVYNSKQQYKFDNTIRSSDTNVDEVYKNIYKFKSDDYYNVPCNRGIIVKIFNLVNSIYVHTQHSLFKFTGSNNIASTEGEIALKEGDVFDNGIQELFDSKNGYAGLQNKHQCIVMFDSYVFWDNYVQKIYAFGGEGKLASISDSIFKIIKDFKPTDIIFISDENNDRFFVNFKKDTEGNFIINGEDNICLSFNFRTNSFVSIHDMNFDHGFSSRFGTYIVNANTRLKNIYSNNTLVNIEYEYIGWSLYLVVERFFVNNMLIVGAYQNCWKLSVLQNPDMRTTKDGYGVAQFSLDIIFNNNYEVIKNIEYINWICKGICYTNGCTYDFNGEYAAEEYSDSLYSGHKLRVYTDECSTDLIELRDENENIQKISNYITDLSDPKSWQYPRYNCGVWSLNYFRNTRMPAISTYAEASATRYPQRLNLVQEDRLVYGKYFVARFIFEYDFKLENVEVKLKNYEQVR